MLQAPTFVTIGHVTRDLHADGSFTLGGTVTFAALTAYRLGLAAGIITSADAQLQAALPHYLPGIALQVRSSAHSTSFANYYDDTGFRTQYLHDRADSLTAMDVPDSWKSAPVILLGPLAQELSPDFVELFPRTSSTILAATPQGWLRRWDDDGRVWPAPWTSAERILPALDILILSHDDLLPFANGNRQAADSILQQWSLQVPLLVATDGRHGATLFEHGKIRRFPAYAAQEIDPTGAGDVFAAAFLTHLYQHHDPGQAVDFANCVASFCIEQVGIEGIPTPEQIEQRRQQRK